MPAGDPSGPHSSVNQDHINNGLDLLGFVKSRLPAITEAIRIIRLLRERDQTGHPKKHIRVKGWGTITFLHSIPC